MNDNLIFRKLSILAKGFQIEGQSLTDAWDRAEIVLEALLAEEIAALHEFKKDITDFEEQKKTKKIVEK